MNQRTEAKRRRLFVISVWVLCVTMSSCVTAQSKNLGEDVSLINLIATPERYHGKVVFISAYTKIGFENMSLCPSKTAYTTKDCLWLEIDPGPYDTEADYRRYQSLEDIWKQFDGQVLSIRGTFNKDKTGHLGAWSGTIENVTEVFGEHLDVDFTSHPPSQRTRQ